MTARQLHLLVGIIFRDAADTLSAAVDSVLRQESCAAKVTILLVDDGSTDMWREALAERLQRQDIHVRRVAFRSTALARNFVLDEADRAFTDVDYICRLDSDDVLAGRNVLQQLVGVLERERPDALVAGNWQVLEGQRLPCPNWATRELLDESLLLERLQRMADGDATAELPSCNTVVRRGLQVRYPLVTSAEDHWYSTTLLLGRRNWRIIVAEDLLFAEYRLRGAMTRRNANTDAYFRARRDLLDYARSQISDSEA